MIRKAFRMSVYEGQESEYERRHNPIWQELADTLSGRMESRAIRSFSIARQAISSRMPRSTTRSAGRRSPRTEVCRRWWHHMRDVMPSNPDDSPVSHPLVEVFHM